VTLTLSEPPPIKRRTRRDPQPRYKPSTTHQLDAVVGAPELVVPGDHLARRVWEIVRKFDFTSADRRRSSLGRRGHDPRRVVAVFVYASLVGVHHASKIAVAVETDAAFRLLSGGHRMPPGTLRRLRAEFRDFFATAHEQTVALAADLGLLKLDETAIDSVRIRAHASSSAARTLVRSKARLAQLLAANVDGLSEDDRAKHEEKVAKHSRAIKECEQEGRTNLVTTNPLAGVIKFPDGAAAPGHRVTVAAAGVQARLIVALLVDASGSDHGKVGAALDAMRATLSKIGLEGTVIRGSLDAGYWGEEDILAAEARAEWADVIIAPGSRGERDRYEREHFTVADDGSVMCPAGRLMKGPTKAGTGLKYRGVGCETCQLRPNCTTTKERALIIHPALERARAKIATAEGKARYGKRIATVEPVFSSIESTMGFRRSGTRHPAAVVAEMYLKALAHNVSRLLAARPLYYVLVAVREFRSTL
jgi:hypothetical protein